MSKARNLSDFISDPAIDSTELGEGSVTTAKLGDQAVTPAKLHNTLDLSSKTVTLPTDGISGNSIHGGVISDFASTGIDDNASATAITIDSSGRVGVGGDPLNDLSVRSSSTNTTTLTVQNTSNLALLNLHAFGNATGVGSQYYNRVGLWSWNGSDGLDLVSGANSSGSNDIKMYTGGYGGTPAVTIDSSGNVGIGTDNPTNKLEVDGGAASTRLRISTTNPGASVAGLVLANSSKSAFNDGIEIVHGAGVTKFNDLAGETQLSVDMTNSRVGIGTTSPATKLHVYDSTQSRVSLQNSSRRFDIMADGDGFTIRDQSAAANRLIVDTNGNVGIGTTSPNTLYGAYTTPLVVTNPTSGALPYIEVRSSPNANQAGILFNREGNTGWMTAMNNSGKYRIAHMASISQTGLTNAKDGNDGITVNTNGNVGIGTHSPYGNSRLHVFGTTADTGTTGNSQGLSIATGGGTSCPIYFGSETHSAQKSMYLSGYWMYYRGHQNEGHRFIFSQPSGYAPRSDTYQFKYNSATRPGGSTSWDGFSDARAKENVRDMTGALDTINQLRPVRYDWTDDYANSQNMWNLNKDSDKPYEWYSVKENGYDTERKNDQYGFIAQEFEEVFPKDVKESELQLGDEYLTDFKTVSFDSLVPVLTKAIQEQQEIIEELRARIEALEG